MSVPHDCCGQSSTIETSFDVSKKEFMISFYARVVVQVHSSYFQALHTSLNLFLWTHLLIIKDKVKEVKIYKECVI